MPFGKKEIDADEISQAMFGMNAEEVKAKLGKIDSVENTVTEVKNIAFAQTGTLAEINEKIGKISTPYSRQPEVQNTSGDKKEPIRWDEDAEGAYSERIKPIVAGILDTRSMIAQRNAMDEINASNPDLPWHKLSKEIEDKTKDASLEQKAQPQFWKNVYYVCVGEKRQEIERDKSQKSGRFFTETASSSIVVDNNEGTKKPEDKLNQAQLDAARKSGLSPADYAKELATMQVWN